MTRVKVCGITNLDDALNAVQYGAWALGFIFYKPSPRYISPLAAKRIISKLPHFVTPVGVFVDAKQEIVEEISDDCGLQTLQFHGAEDEDYCCQFKKYFVIKAIRVSDRLDKKLLARYSVQAFLFDSFKKGQYGGTGQTFDWNLIKPVKRMNIPIILSGGMNCLNVLEAIQAVQPYAVDVSSGVERLPGKKDKKLLKQFMSRVHSQSCR